VPASTGLYSMLLQWFTIVAYPAHATARLALAKQVSAVLHSQSLRPAARMRALLSAATVPARQRYHCLARALNRPSLSPAGLTPTLVRAALALVPPDRQGRTVLALDSVRCGGWEVFTLGVVWHSRVLVVGWTVLPYPWPPKAFTPAVAALIRQVAAVWPASRPAHLVADRGFPSKAFFSTLREVGWGWTVRLQARSWVVTTAGHDGVVRGLLQQAPETGWTQVGASYGRGPQAVAATLVLGRPAHQPPLHQTGPASRRRRRQQAERRVFDLQHKHPGRPADASAETDRWLALFTTLPTAQEAAAVYRRRWAIEGSYRDAQGGWDGQHGWDLEPLLARETAGERVARLVGLWALSSLVQTWVGGQVAHGPVPVRQVAAQWTTTHRLSVWARGKFALCDDSGRLTAWLQMTMNRGAALLAGSPPPRLLETA